MSARGELFKGLIEHACYFDDEEANKLIDNFAHELAEQQRAQAQAGFEKDIYIDELSMGFTGAIIDGIDPLKDTT